MVFCREHTIGQSSPLQDFLLYVVEDSFLLKDKGEKH